MQYAAIFWSYLIEDSKVIASKFYIFVYNIYIYINIVYEINCTYVYNYKL